MYTYINMYVVIEYIYYVRARIFRLKKVFLVFLGVFCRILVLFPYDILIKGGNNHEKKEDIGIFMP